MISNQFHFILFSCASLLHGVEIQYQLFLFNIELRYYLIIISKLQKKQMTHYNKLYEVPWLSTGKMLERVFDLREESGTFLKEKKLGAPEF